MDDFNTLSNRLLSRAPLVGIALAQQLINDNWRKLQSRQQWSFRRRHNTFSPPGLITAGIVSTNVSAGLPNVITGIGTAWTPALIGRQFRAGGVYQPYYTIVGVQNGNQLTLDLPWAGLELAGSPYQIQQCYYTVPADFGYFYAIVSVNGGWRLYQNMTQEDLAFLDPQRASVGDAYSASFRDYTPTYNGIINQPIPVSAIGPPPISTTTLGYNYIADASYIIQIINGGQSGDATYQWMRVGQQSFTGPLITSDQPQDMMDGVQIYWPVLPTDPGSAGYGNDPYGTSPYGGTASYNAGDLFVVNAVAQKNSGRARYELWPNPTYQNSLYPYIYIAKESDLTPDQPQLPPSIANRGEVILEMALESCAMYPGPDSDRPNPYFNLALAKYHAARAEQMIWDLERNDQEISESNITYEHYPFAPAPWLDGSWQQRHAPFMS